MALRLTEAEYAALIRKPGEKVKQARPVKMAPPLPPSVYEPRLPCPSCGNDYGGKWPFEGAPNDCVVCNGTGYAPNLGRIILYLPLPDRKLHPNGRAHVMEKAGLTKEARQYACVVAREALRGARPLWERSQGFRRFYLTRSQDDSNLAGWTKAYEDGLQDAKLILNDSGVTWERNEIHASRTAPHLEIELREKK